MSPDLPATHRPQRAWARSTCTGGWRREHPAQVGCQVSRPAVRRRAEQVDRISDSGEHEQAVAADRRGAFDVGVEPVTYDERTAGVGSQNRLTVHRRVGLSGGDRGRTGCVSQRGHQRTVAWQPSAWRRHGRIEIRCHPQHPVVDGDRAFGQLAPVQIRRIALDNGHRSVVGTRHRRQAPLPKCLDETRRAEHQNCRPRRQPVGQVVGGGLRRRDHFIGFRGDAEIDQVSGYRLRRSTGVVCYESQPHATFAGGPQRLWRPGDGLRAEIYDPIQVEQGHVVPIGQRRLRGSKGPRNTAAGSGGDGLARHRERR